MLKMKFNLSLFEDNIAIQYKIYTHVIQETTIKLQELSRNFTVMARYK